MQAKKKSARKASGKEKKRLVITPVGNSEKPFIAREWMPHVINWMEMPEETNN